MGSSAMPRIAHATTRSTRLEARLTSMVPHLLDRAVMPGEVAPDAPQSQRGSNPRSSCV